MKRSREEVIESSSDDAGTSMERGATANKSTENPLVICRKDGEQRSSTSNPCHHKRPRTDRYLQEFRSFEKTRETMMFFQRRLVSSSVNQQQLNQQQQRILQNLNKQWASHEQQFQSMRQRFMDNAQEKLDVKNSIDCLRKQVEQQRCRAHISGSTLSRCVTPSILMLNLGKETTQAVFGLIEAYAGNPSDCEVLDCQKLLSIASAES
jgi:hypothetical protein